MEIDPAQRIAETVLEGFDRHYRLFSESTVQAKRRFEEADWLGAQRAVSERIAFYDERVRECVERLTTDLDAEALDDGAWQAAKLRYIGLLYAHKRPELAETFFNSVVTRILHRTYHVNDVIFVRAAVSTEYIESDPPIYTSWYPGDGELAANLAEAFGAFGWSRPFTDLDGDVGRALERLRAHLGGWPVPQPNFQLQVLSAPFYRNKAAFVIARIVNGYEQTPFVIPVLHDARGSLTLDAMLLDGEHIANLFSLSRAYFMAAMDVPSGTVEFLQAIMPTRPRSELYTMVGLGKQGKTLFYRDLLQHLHHSDDLFVEAPGIRGQVMHVFNLPSYPYVIKVIRDVFGPSKTTDRETVRAKFRMVKQVDRVGRMTDALEFTDLALPLARFAPELLEQLHQLARSSIELDGDRLILRHCYVERRMTPLNLYLETASPEEADRVVAEYGEAIRELAIANIFPGDLLWRNFGVTGHGRVVFYDYDEIEYLTDCSFRAIPPAPTPEIELSGEPWYPVGPRDVYPEELGAILLQSPIVREPFLRHHQALLEPAFWIECQERVAAGEIVDFFAYPQSARL